MSDGVAGGQFEALYAKHEALGRGTRAEIVAGEVRVLPWWRPAHTRIGSRLLSRLGRHYGCSSCEGTRSWVILHKPELRFSDEIRCPDLAGWRVERYEEPEDNPIRIVPDWICEVLSPFMVQTARVEKVPLYVSHGVGHLWLVDPSTQVLEVYRRREDGVWVVASTHGAEVARPEPFDAVPFDIGALFRKPAAPAKR